MDFEYGQIPDEEEAKQDLLRNLDIETLNALSKILPGDKFRRISLRGLQGLVQVAKNRIKIDKREKEVKEFKWKRLANGEIVKIPKEKFEGWGEED